ncbi:MAG: protoheme IX farnesyltransferase [Leptospirales bacterium]
MTITTAIGYLLVDAPRTSHIIWPVLGILLIGLSSAALNQLQDRKLDAKMNRTKDRPLPSGRVKPLHVVIFILLYLVAGLTILVLKTNWIATALGLSAFIWYNGFYTYLKRVSPIAVIPGSVIGGVPPGVGWAAAGGDILDPFILAVCFFMFVWQIPHFWLLLFLYGDDYEKAGLPTLIKQTSEKTLRYLTFAGIFVTVLSALAIPIAGDIYIKAVWVALIVISIGILWMSRNLIFPSKNMNYKKTFIAINIYSVLVLFVIFSMTLIHS